MNGSNQEAILQKEDVSNMTLNIKTQNPARLLLELSIVLQSIFRIRLRLPENFEKDERIKRFKASEASDTYASVFRSLAALLFIMLIIYLRQYTGSGCSENYPSGYFFAFIFAFRRHRHL